MKKFGKTLALLAAGALLFGSVLSSCSSGGSSSDDDDPKITITPDTTSVEVYGNVTFKATADGNELSDLNWNSSDPSVATVSGGTLTAAKAGKTSITASKGGYETSDAVEITVNAKTTTYSVETLGDIVITDYGETKTAKVGASETAYTVTTYENGTMTLTAEGATTYTVTVSENGTATVSDGTNTYTGTQKKDFTISAENDATSVEIDGELQLSTTVADGVTVSWKSSDESIATVTSAGVVTGVAEGEVKITASADGYNDATITLTVKAAENTDEWTWNASDCTAASGKTLTDKNDVSDLELGTTNLSFVGATGKNTYRLSTSDASKVASIEVAHASSTSNKIQGAAVISVSKDSIIELSLGSTSRSNTTSGIGLYSDSDYTTLVAVISSAASSDTTSVSVVDNLISVTGGTGAATVTYSVSAGTYYLATTDTAKNVRLSKIAVTSSATLSSISVSLTDEAKAKVYSKGDSLDKTGITVTAAYSDGSTKIVTSKAEFSTLDSSESGTKKIEVSYTEGSVTEKTSFEVTVNAEITLLKITATTTKTDYNVGDELDLSTITVKGTYSNGTTNDVPITKENVTGFDSTKAVDSQKITVTYGGQKDTFTVKISAVPVTSVTVSAADSATAVAVGKTLALTATVEPSNATDKTVSWTSDNEGVAKVDANGVVTGVAAGTANITATAGGVASKAYAVTVEAVKTTQTVSWDGAATTAITMLVDSDGTAPTFTLSSDFSGTANKIEKKKGWVKGSSDDVFLYVDATSGKFALDSSNSRIQVSSGTVVYIPVSAGSVVTVVTQENKAANNTFNLAGIAGVTTGDDVTGTTEYTAEKAGYVVLEATGSTYLASITVTNVNTTDDHSKDLVEFVAASTTISNDKTTLGFVASKAESSDTNVFTVGSDLTSSITLTSAGMGTSTVKLSDESGASLEIDVTVERYGKITVGTFQPYSASAAKIAYFSGYTKDSTLSYTGTVSGNKDLITTAGDAVYGYNTSLKVSDSDTSSPIGTPFMGEGKSDKGYGIAVGTTASITTSDNIWWVDIPVTLGAAAKLTHVSANSSCNKSSNYYLKVFIGETEIASAKGSSSVAAIDSDISENNALAANTATTIRVAFVGIEKKSINATNATTGNLMIGDIELTFDTAE